MPTIIRCLAIAFRRFAQTVRAHIASTRADCPQAAATVPGLFRDCWNLTSAASPAEMFTLGLDYGVVGIHRAILTGRSFRPKQGVPPNKKGRVETLPLLRQKNYFLAGLQSL
jgi:hypothetical protein